MILSLLILICFIMIIKGSHFNGGTITWEPIDPYTNSSSIVITITQSYSWTLSKVDCNINVPISTSSRSNENKNLTCISGCSNDGNYSSTTLDILTDCISSSTSLDMMKSQRSQNVTLTVGALFSIAYRDKAWRSLENTNNGDSWSIVCLIDLRRRPDGIFNTPPVSTVASPQYVVVNKTTQIKIPVSDVNTGDNVRCRWATNSGSSSIDECASVCYSNKIPTGTNMTDCVLTFTGTQQGKWYAITIQVEDFIDTTSTTAMSSVPVQFLIYVLPLPTCSEVPLILPLTDCLEVQAGIPVSFTLYAMNYCNRTKTIITDISVTMEIIGMNISRLYNSTTNTSLSYIILQWTPRNDQIGSEHFCTLAYTNEKVQSEEYCVTFIVKNVSNFCQTTTTTSTSTTSTTQTTSSTTTTTTQTTTSTTETTSTTSQTTTTTTDTTTSTTETTTTTSQTTTTTTDTTTSTTASTSTTSQTTTTTTDTTTSTTASTSTTSQTTTSTTQTTTTTTSTSTSSTSTSTTTVTTTTSQTTTSVTTSTVTTQTTTTTEAVPNNVNIPLIVGLSLLALLLGLCCCCCWWWYYYYWSAKGRRRQPYEDKEKEISQTSLFNNRKNKNNNQKLLLIENESSIRNSSSNSSVNNPIERQSTSTSANNRKQNASIIKVSILEKSSEQENFITNRPSLDKSISSMDQRSKLRGSSASVYPLNKVPTSANAQHNFVSSSQINLVNDIPKTENCLTNPSNKNTEQKRPTSFNAVTVKKIKKSQNNTKIKSIKNNNTLTPDLNQSVLRSRVTTS